MMIRRIRKIAKYIVMPTFLVFIVESILPLSSYALTSGPSSPEFSSFEPVATTNMVNEFTGDFTYNLPVLNIPGPDGGGYAMSLSYHSGLNAEQEASWVGFGWTLNPGAINRGTRGFPDDFNGVDVKYYNKTVPNWTVTSGNNTNLELFGIDAESGLGLSFSNTTRYNNYQGFSKSFSFGLDAFGYGSLNLNVDPLGLTFDANVNPMKVILKKTEESDKEIDKSKDKVFDVKKILKNGAKTIRNKLRNNVTVGVRDGIFGAFSYNATPRSLNVPKYRGYGMNFTTSIQPNPSLLPIGVQGASFGISGNLNIQLPYKQDDKKAYGYMYNFDGGDEQKIGDYFVEKQNAYDKQDLFIGAPFNNADNFAVSGEGVGGGFRMYHTKTKKNLFLPEKIDGDKNKTTIYQGGLEFQVGPNFGIGLDLGKGTHRNVSKLIGGYLGQLSSNNNETIFRFNNDLGGKVEYTVNGATHANSGYSLHEKVNGNTGKINNSSYIENTKDANGKISSFSVKAPSGISYKYGQAVYSKNEYQLGFGLDQAYSIKNNFLLYQPSQLKTEQGVIGVLDASNDKNLFKTVAGQGITESYASSFLLTEIMTPDYVDADADGKASDDDFGGWTKFAYHKKHSAYKWRTPYNGLYYNKGALSNPLDDQGNVTYGEKEVYYLKTVETKTHVAFFVTNKTNKDGVTRFDNNLIGDIDVEKYLTGSGQDRLDGLSANGTEITASNITTAKGNQQLEYLEKIVLFSKSDEEKPVVVVNFKYDYSLAKGIPNSVNAGSSQNNGKLTLKKVWFEYEGIVNAKISPYEFKYEYKKNYPNNLQAQYPEITSYGSQLSSYVQNPEYNKYSLDAWGNYGYNQVDRKNKMNPWVDQDPNYNQYDPAAWHLKQIKLPSGAEIHVQYEEKDYAYVQAKNVMSMVTIFKVLDGKYYLKTEDIGLEPSNPDHLDELNKLVGLLNEMKNRKEKMYFKFLYGLNDLNYPSLNGGCNEYIKGYVNIQNVGVDNGRPYVEFEPGSKNLPKTICEDFVYTNRGDLCDSKGFQEHTESIVGTCYNGFSFFPYLGKAVELSTKLLGTLYQNPNRWELCKRINNSLSYLRIPMPMAKKGGGVRVKRILLYDKGLETGSAELYGTEYFYQQENGQSSGVATNEPMGAREENPYVNVADKIKQKFFHKIVGGRDMENNETPVGESILPGASIGYSRIVVRSIHTGKSHTGYSVNEYFTAKDFPTLGHFYATNDVYGMSNDYTDLQAHTNSNKMVIPAGIVSLRFSNVHSKQGFRYVLNSMHGQMKKKAVYGGDFNDPYLLSSQEYEYFKPGEKVQLYDGTNLSMDTPGKEEDITFTYKKIKDKAIDINVEFDISVGIFLFPLFFNSIVPSLGYNESNMTLETNSKVIRYPAIVKSVKTFQEGASDLTEYLTFDKATGQVLLTKNTDGFNQLNLKEANNGTVHDGSYYTLTIPAYQKYPDMGQKSSDPNNLNMLTQTCASYKTYADDPRDLNNMTIPENSLGNVISADVQTYSNGWMSSTSSSSTNSGSQPTIPNSQMLSTSGSYTGIGIAQSALDNIYRPKASYKFKSDVVEGKEGADRIYNAGMYKNFTAFNFANEGSNVVNSLGIGWQKMSEVTLYSPNGQSVEEQNILGIKSTAKYGYDGNTLPILVAQNAPYNQVDFEDFENTSAASSTSAHTGKKSQLFYGSNYIFNGKLYPSGDYWVMFWGRTYDYESNSLIYFADKYITFGGQNFDCEEVATVGEWTLFRSKISSTSSSSVLLNLSATSVNIAKSNTDSNFPAPPTDSSIYIDDIRIQPIDASMKTYVYDVNTLKLVAEFDDQHFATLYQYNSEGKLVRIMKETEKGIVTIKETQYNIPKESR